MVECFDSNKLFTDARNRAFIDILNIFEGTPKYLAAYCHDQLKFRLKQVNFDDASTLVNYLIKLFCCLHARDSFINGYKKYL